MAISKKPLKFGGYSWIVRVEDANGKWFPSKTFEKKVDAEVYEAHLISEKSKGAKILPGSRYTLNEYWEKWKIERGGSWDDGWRKTKESLYRTHIAPVLGELLLTDISKSDISRLMGMLRDKELSASTRNHIHQILNPMFRDAVDFYEILLKNPVLRDHRAKGVERQRDFWKAAESRVFLQSVSEHSYGIAYWIMLWCGLRIGEVLALRFGDLDLDRRVIYVKRQWSKNQCEFKPLKNRREFICQLPKPLVNFLQSKLPSNMEPETLLVMSNVGTVASYKTVKAHLDRACKTVGLKRLTPHELRHSMTELWIEYGANEQDLKKQLNHKSEVSTRKYIHDTPERVRRIADQMEMVNAVVH